MNMITGALLVGAAAVLFLRQMPPLRSTTAKVYGAAAGFGIFSIAFPLNMHWALLLIGVFLQLVALVCCVVAAHDYRAEKAVAEKKKSCRKLRQQLETDAVSDCWIYIAGTRAGERKRLK